MFGRQAADGVLVVHHAGKTGVGQRAGEIYHGDAEFARRAGFFPREDVGDDPVARPALQTQHRHVVGFRRGEKGPRAPLPGELFNPLDDFLVKPGRDRKGQGDLSYCHADGPPSRLYHNTLHRGMRKNAGRFAESGSCTHGSGRHTQCIKWSAAMLAAESVFIVVLEINRSWNPSAY